jgi:hypothetical protein
MEKDMGARLTAPMPTPQPHRPLNDCELEGNHAPRASNCNGGVNPLSAKTFNAVIVASLISCAGSRKKATTHVLHAIVAIVQVEQSMIMCTNVKAGTDKFSPSKLGRKEYLTP